MPVFTVGRKSVGVGWFLSEAAYHFPAAAPSKPLDLCKGRLSHLQNQLEQCLPFRTAQFYEIRDTPNFKGSKMFFQLTLENSDILGVVVLMFCFVGFSGLESWRSRRRNINGGKIGCLHADLRGTHFHLVELFSEREY